MLHIYCDKICRPKVLSAIGLPWKTIGRTSAPSIFLLLNLQILDSVGVNMLMSKSILRVSKILVSYDSRCFSDLDSLLVLVEKSH